MKYNNMEMDHRVILELIKKNSTVLDLGCGDGEGVVRRRLQDRLGVVRSRCPDRGGG